MIEVVAATLIATTIYLLLTIAALLSIICPPLQSLSSHGKTRSRNKNTQDDALRIFQRLQHFAFNGLIVNKCRFIDFYAAGIITTVLIVYATIASNATNSNEDFMPLSQIIHRWLPTFLLMVHLIRRYCECKWVQKSGTSSQMHLAGYLLGIIHYICLPFVLVPLPMSCSYNESDIPSGGVGVCDILLPSRITSVQSLLDIMSVIGCIYFQYEQHRHHVILGNLRNNPNSASTYYSLPTGGWFERISCPHYLAEIMIYFMFALLLNKHQQYIARESDMRAWIGHLGNSMLSWLDPYLGNDSMAVLITMYKSRQWILLVWVTTNLSISATRTHDWYLEKFDVAYPRCRKRLIPFVW